MAGITLAQAESSLALWLTAEEKVASGQEYEIGNRRLRRADLEEIRKTIDYWDSKCQKLARSGGTGRMRVQNATPL